ncbi:hypothetical protein B0H14DRAFT_2631366 [Mycena olivaceomarginata]|nr:hypothetical protein B0H14DRAFT_2631366 [Mycena olivaceomarginata]
MSVHFLPLPPITHFPAIPCPTPHSLQWLQNSVQGHRPSAIPNLSTLAVSYCPVLPMQSHHLQILEKIKCPRAKNIYRAFQARIQKQGQEEQDAKPKVPHDSPNLVPVPEPPRKLATSSAQKLAKVKHQSLPVGGRNGRRNFDPIEVSYDSDSNSDPGMRGAPSGMKAAHERLPAPVKTAGTPRHESQRPTKSSLAPKQQPHPRLDLTQVPPLARARTSAL